MIANHVNEAQLLNKTTVTELAPKDNIEETSGIKHASIY